MKQNTQDEPYRFNLTIRLVKSFSPRYFDFLGHLAAKYPTNVKLKTWMTH